MTSPQTPPSSSPDDDWTDLSRAWAEPRADEPPIDAALVRALKRRDFLARLNFASEIAGGVAVLGVMIWAVWRGLPLAAAAAAAGFALFALIVTLWSRRGDPGLLTDTPQAVLRSAIGQARTGYRWALAGVAISIAGMGFLIVILWIGLLTPAQRVPILAVGVGGLAICIGFYLNHARRCRRRMAAHQAALEALFETPSDNPT